ncbi:MAG: hypothetical protein IT435_20215 [Phycisphaerales bacterium]|nr:hypothetical protein [Phycisphaerales bacterium]
MSRTNTRSTRSMLTLAATIGSAVLATPTAVLAHHAGSPDPVAPQATSQPAEAINQASRLIGDGQVVRGRSILMSLAESGKSAGLTDAERGRVTSLLTLAANKMAGLDPMEVSLQKAELALDQADLRAAERYTSKIAQSQMLTAEQDARLDQVVEGIKTRREQLAPQSVGVISQAVKDYAAGRYAESKSALESVFRSGITLPPEAQKLADDYRTRIVELEQKQGVIFSTRPLAMGMLRQPENTPAQPDAQPAPQPEVVEATQQPADPVAEARRFEASGLLVEADKAFESGQFDSAADKYGQLLAGYREYLSPDQISHAENRINEARLKLNRTAGDPIGDYNRDMGLAKQQTLAEFDNQLAQSRAALVSGDVARARELAAGARFTLNSGRNNFSDAELETLNKRVTDQLTEIEKRNETMTREQLDAQTQALIKKSQDAERDRLSEKERKIREHLIRARDLQREMKYREALQVVDQILFLDEINPAGLILKDILQDAYLYREFHLIRDQQLQGTAENALNNERSLIMPSGIINFGSDWPSVSARRGEPIQFAETPEDRRVRTVLETKRIPVTFKDNTFKDVIGFIQNVSNLDIDTDWPSLEAIGITSDTPVNLELRNVTLRSVLDRVMSKIGDPGNETNRAGWEISDGVLRIASEELLRKNVVTLVYDIRDLLLEVPDYDQAPEFDLQSVLQSSNAGGGGGGQSPFRDTQQNRDGQNRRSLEDRTRDLLDIVQQNIDPSGWIDAGGTTGRVQSLNGNLIITNTPKNHQAIDGLLKKLREVRAMQINVESRFLLVNTEFFEQIGFDIDVYFNANNNQVRAARANDPTIQASDFFANNGDLNRAVTGAGTDTDGDGVSDTFVTQGVVNPRPWSPIGVTQNSSGLAAALIPREGFVGDVLAGTPAPALGIAGQFLDDIQVDFLIQATQADRRSVRLTAPRLTFTNGQISNIYVATQTAFVSDLQPIVSDSAVGFDPTLSTLNEGVVMLLEGTISSDRRYVTLNVDVAVSKLEGFQNRAVTAVAGGQLVSSADTQSFIQAPTTTVTRVQTTVTVPDQGTILIGGQRLINEVETESGVPILSKIPILNRFFSNRVQVKEEQTLIVLIKPTILIQNEEEERNFPGLADTLRAGLGG